MHHNNLSTSNLTTTLQNLSHRPQLSAEQQNTVYAPQQNVATRHENLTAPLKT